MKRSKPNQAYNLIASSKGSLRKGLNNKNRVSGWKYQEEAPREKLLQKGAQSLSDAELLAIFLRVGYRGKNVLELASELINHHGLKWLLSASRTDFCSKKGLGDAKYVQLQAVMELARRYLEDLMKRETSALGSSNKMRKYLMYKLGDSPNEKFACIFMDNKLRVLEYREMFNGTVDSAPIYPREIVKQALSVNAVNLVVAHNHPSGVTEPSYADKYSTELIKSACEIMGIRLIDHYIISGNKVLSFTEEGLL